MPSARMILALLTILAQDPAGTISGRITDAVTHQTIRGALVTTVGGSRDLTDDDGRYTVRHPSGADVQIRVALPGYSTLQKTTRFADGDFLGLDLELHPLARIMGKVTDKETGEPIDRVLSFRRTDNSGGRDIMPDKDGAFDLGGLEPGDYSMMLRQDNDAVTTWGVPQKPGHSYGVAVYPAAIHIEQGAKRFVEFRLTPLEAHSVEGTIEVPPGRETEPMTVTLWHLGIPLPAARVGNSGPFRIDGLTRGDYGLVAEVGKAAIAVGRQAFTITDHDIGPLKVTLSPAASVSGTVRMAEENVQIPPKLEVWLNSASGWGSCAGFCMVMPSQALLLPGGLASIFRKPIPVVNGRFQADGVAPDDYWPELFGSESTGPGAPALRGLPDGYAVLSGDGQPVGIYGGAQIDFVLTSKPGAIAGVVRDSSQAPVAGSTVTLAPESDTRRHSTAKSGPAGEFIFRNLAPGKYRLNGALVEVGPGQTVSVVAGGTQ